LDDVRAHALNNIGTARCNAGDLEGIADLERSVEIAIAGDAPGELARAYNNLSTMYLEQMDIPRALEIRREAVRVAESVGNKPLARYAGGMLLFDNYFTGNWTDLVPTVRRLLEESERLGGGYQDGFFHATLGLVALARGEDADALVEGQRAL